MWAINVNGRGQRLAAGLTSDGQWDWRTFFTGGMVTADVINAGTMKADRVRAGLLTDEKGNNYWDLTNGEFSLSAGAKLGDTSVEDLFNGIDELDKTMDGIAEDGIITEAEHAAVSKIMQTVEKESADVESEYTALINSDDLQAQFKTVLQAQYEAVYSVNGTHARLELMIQNVLGTTTAEELADAMQLYEIAYSDYSDTLKTYYSVARQAQSMIEQKQAQDKVDTLDTSLTQREVFNRLTNNGASQGIYLSGSLLYINASYIETGTISDRTGRNYWNLTNGTFVTRKGTIGGLTIESGYVGNSVFRLMSNGIRFYREDNLLGHVGTNSLSGDSSKRGIVFDLDTSGNYMTWASRDNPSDDSYMMKLTYVRDSMAGFVADRLSLGCDLDGKNWCAYNFWIDPNSGGANGGITQTINYVQVLAMNSDGTVARWGANGRMDFKRGMLVGLSYYTQ